MFASKKQKEASALILIGYSATVSWLLAEREKGNVPTDEEIAVYLNKAMEDTKKLMRGQ